MTLRLFRTRVGPIDSPIWLKFCMHAWLGVPITKLIFLDCQHILRGKLRLMAIWSPSRTWKRGWPRATFLCFLVFVSFLL